MASTDTTKKLLEACPGISTSSLLCIIRDELDRIEGTSLKEAQDAHIHHVINKHNEMQTRGGALLAQLEAEVTNLKLYESAITRAVQPRDVSFGNLGHSDTSSATQQDAATFSETQSGTTQIGDIREFDSLDFSCLSNSGSFRKILRWIDENHIDVDSIIQHLIHHNPFFACAVSQAGCHLTDLIDVARKEVQHVPAQQIVGGIIRQSKGSGVVEYAPLIEGGTLTSHFLLPYAIDPVAHSSTARETVSNNAPDDSPCSESLPGNFLGIPKEMQRLKEKISDLEQDNHKLRAEIEQRGRASGQDSSEDSLGGGSDGAEALGSAGKGPSSSTTTVVHLLDL